MGSELPGGSSRLAGLVSPGLITGVLLAAALVGFVFQNTEDTQVKWLVFEFEQPLWVVLLITAMVTLVVTELLGAARRRRKRKT